jgi:hypothetical protein
MRSRSVACVVAAALAATLGSLVSPRTALATRDYAKAEGKDCGYCHVSDKGSGPRNPKGREYEANGHKFGVKSWSCDANEQRFLRANSAIVTTWYAEAARLLDDLAKDEKLAGGAALVEATRERFKMFKGPWLRAAKKLLGQGDRGLPNALGFLVKVESQFGATDEGKEATRLLDGLAADAKTKEATLAARGAESARVVFLEGATEFQLGHADRARELLEKALADPRAKAFEKDLREVLAKLPAAK